MKIYSDPKITIYHGDCIEVMRLIPSNSVDLICADPPYGTTRNKWDSVLPLDLMWKEYRRIAKPSAAIVLTSQTPFDKILGASNISELRYEWVWEKTNPTGHLNAKKMPMKAHENVLVFYRKQPTYNPIKTSGHVRKVATKRSDDSSPNYGKQKVVGLHYDSTERYPRSVLTFPSDKQTCNLHPTQKPLALMEYLVRTYSNPDDVVLDNCYGSGTTGLACLNTGRRFIGIENDAHFALVGKKRILGELQTNQDPIATAPT